MKNSSALFYWFLSVAFAAVGAVLSIIYESLIPEIVGGFIGLGLVAYMWKRVIFDDKEKEDDADGSLKGAATRQWVDSILNAKTSNCVRVAPAFENRNEYKGSVVFKGKRYAIAINKNKLYGYETTGGGRRDYERSLCKLTGEVWIGGVHHAQTRESECVSEVVADIQQVLNSKEHANGELLLQIRTECYRYINSEDVEKGWPAACVGFIKIGQASLVENFVME